MYKKSPFVKGLFAACGFMLASASAHAGNYYGSYEVTITNLTKAQSFTPVLVSSHRAGVSLFKAGEPASNELASLAESGNIAPLTSLLEANHKVADVNNSEGLLVPGASVTVTVAAHYVRRISLAAMLIPTNDAFVSLNSVKAPKGYGTKTYYARAYDAGSEPNDEMCVNIPGPVCGGAGLSPEEDGEGFVHIHNGMHGIGDLSAATYDWRNPVAKVTIRRAH